MNKPFITATAFAALLAFGASGAFAQQAAPKVEAPAIQKVAPVDSGKAAGSGKANVGKAETGKTATKVSDGKVKREQTNSCGTIKDKAAHDACMKSHAANSKAAKAKDQTAKTPAKAAPDVKTAPRVGG